MRYISVFPQEMILGTTLIAETSGTAAAMLNRGFISEAESELEASQAGFPGGDADSTLIGELADDRSIFFTEETKVDPKEMEALKEELAAAKKKIEILTKDKEELLALLHQQKSIQEKLAGVNKKISKFLVPEMEEREEAREAPPPAANFRVPKRVSRKFNLVYLQLMLTERIEFLFSGNRSFHLRQGTAMAILPHGLRNCNPRNNLDFGLMTFDYLKELEANGKIFCNFCKLKIFNDLQFPFEFNMTLFFNFHNDVREINLDNEK